MSEITVTELVDHIHINWIDMDNRQIWIHGDEFLQETSEAGTEPGVEYRMATKTIKNLHILRHLSKTDPVIIHLHTCGGIWEDGMAIYDTIKLMPYHVTMISYTHARSMSSLILQAADERLLMPSSYFMYHLGSLEVNGPSKAVYSSVEYAVYCDKMMLDIYVEKCTHGEKFKDWSPEKIRSYLRGMMNRKIDVFLTPETAIEYGFADGVVNEWP